MTDPADRDKELEQYLEGGSALSRAYREISGELPPAHLDARILSEARRADAPTSAAPSPFSGRWMVPASLAVIVLAVSLVALLPEPEVRLQDAGKNAAGIAGGDAASARADRADEAGPAAQTDFPALKRLSEPARAASESADSGLPAENRAAEAAARREAISGRSIRGEEPPAGLEQNSRPSRPAIEPELAPEPAGGDDAGSSPAAAPPPVAPAAPQAEKAQAISRPPDAVAWLERISRLIKNGELDAAAEELDAFRQRYPSVEIPPEILAAVQGRR